MRARCVALHLCALVGLVAASTAQAHAARLILEVRLPPNAHGRVAYLLFNSADGFPKDKSKAVVHGFSHPVGHEALETIDLGQLASGRYAASVYLDENGNGKLDSGMFGIPKEPVGASNNPRSRLGPPRFGDSVFTVASGTQTIQIDLVRP